jgi:hypothetical protein
VADSQAGSEQLEFGGLRFDVSFRAPNGATLRVEGRVADRWQEVLRFDDFVDSPHYHAPADGSAVMFDRAAHGDPMEWYIAQIRDHLPQWLTDSGYGDMVPSVDTDVVAANAPRIRDAMVACVPAGFTRVPGVGLQRVGAEPTTAG